MTKEQAQTNVNASLWAEALRHYTEDRGAEDRARGVTKRHQLAYEHDGINPVVIRQRYKEANMTRAERAAAYAEEIVSRQALGFSIWDADTEADFDRLMERARATETAPQEDLDRIAGAVAYSDGFNSGAHGGMTVTDNPHPAGSIQHQQWELGCADGIGEKPREAAPMQAAQPANGTATAAPDAPKKRGRPPRKTPVQLLEENAAKFGGDQTEPDANDPPFSLFEETMPATPEMPG